MTDYAADPVWADEWERILGPTFEVGEKDRYRRWLQAGRRHAVDLQRELGSGCRVVYWHENEKV